MRDRIFLTGALIAGLLTLCCFVPLAGAWWYRDDFWMLTLSRYVDSPVAFWTSDHSASFFYRPLVMTLWWASVKLFAINPLPQYAINGVLQWGVAVAFGAWIRALTRNDWTGVVAMCFYAVHPVAMRTAEWLSDRFDLLATGFGFIACSMMVSTSTSRWRRPCLCLAAALACTSKESGFLVLPLVAAHWMSQSRQLGGVNARARLDTAFVGIVVALVIVGRIVVLSARGGPSVDALLIGSIPSGLLAFFGALPGALIGHFDADASLGQAVPLLAVIVLMLTVWHAFWGSNGDALSRRTLLLAVTLMVATGLLHAPVAAQNLYGGALLRDPITARLFYASLAGGFLLLVAPCLTIIRIVRIHRRWWWLLCALGVATMTTQSIAIAQSWAALTSSSTRSLLVEVVNKVNEKTLFNQCRIVVRTPLADIPDFQRLSDVMVKALASDKAGHLLRCVVVSADDVPTFAIVANDFCADGGLSRIARLHPGVKPVSFANLCYQFFALPYVREDAPLSNNVDIY